VEVYFCVDNKNMKAFLDNAKEAKEWTSLLVNFEPRAKIVEIIERKERVVL